MTKKKPMKALSLAILFASALPGQNTAGKASQDASSTVLSASLPVSVLAYGAKGNCSSDDRPAFQAALNAIYTAGGGTLIVPTPSGCYLLNSFTSGTSILTFGQFRGAPVVLKIIGNTAAIKSSLPGSVMLALSGYIRDFELVGIEMQNTHGLTKEDTVGVGIAGGSGDKIGNVSIHHNTFRDFSRTIALSGVQSSDVSNNRFLYTLGHDSGTTDDKPNVGVWAFCNQNGTTHQVSITDNYWDGAIANTVAGTSTLHPMDGFVYGQALSWFVKGNTIRNHGDEGIFLARTLATSAAITGATYSRGVVIVLAPEHKLGANGTNNSLPPGAQLYVTISGVSGMTDINREFQATIVDANHFSIVKTTSQAYTSGGSVTDDRERYSHTVEGNAIDDSPVDGEAADHTYCIRADVSNSVIRGNTCSQSARGIFAYGYDTSPYPHNIRILDNVVNMKSLASDFGIAIKFAMDVEIRQNSIYWQSYAPISTTVYGYQMHAITNGVVRDNTALSDTLASSGTHTGFACGGSSGVTFTNNRTHNMRYGLAMTATNPGVVTVESHVSDGDSFATGNPADANFLLQTLRFMPSSAGYYRIVTAPGALGARFTVDANYDNSFTSLDFDVGSGAYGNPNSVVVTRNVQYNRQIVSKIRVGSEGAYTTVDLYVTDVSGSSTVTVKMDRSSIGRGYMLDPPIYNPAVPSTPSELLLNGGGVQSSVGFSGTKKVGSCVMTIVGGIVTSVTGC